MKPDILTSLLDEARRSAKSREHGNTCYRKDRITPPKRIKYSPVKIYSDFERFQWYFHNRDGLTISRWRDLIDAQMRAEEQPDAKTA